MDENFHHIWRFEERENDFNFSCINSISSFEWELEPISHKLVSDNLKSVEAVLAEIGKDSTEINDTPYHQNNNLEPVKEVPVEPERVSTKSDTPESHQNVNLETVEAVADKLGKVGAKSCRPNKKSIETKRKTKVSSSANEGSQKKRAGSNKRRKCNCSTRDQVSMDDLQKFWESLIDDFKVEGENMLANFSEDLKKLADDNSTKKDKPRMKTSQAQQLNSTALEERLDQQRNDLSVTNCIRPTGLAANGIGLAASGAGLTSNVIGLADDATVLAANDTGLASNGTDLAANVTGLAASATVLAADGTEVNYARQSSDASSTKKDKPRMKTSQAQQLNITALEARLDQQRNDLSVRNCIRPAGLAANGTGLAASGAGPTSNVIGLADNVTVLAANGTGLASNRTGLAANVTGLAASATVLAADGTELHYGRQSSAMNAINNHGYISNTQAQVLYPNLAQTGSSSSYFFPHSIQTSRMGSLFPRSLQRLNNFSNNPSQVVTENSCSSSAICWRINGGTTRSFVSSQSLSKNIAANNSRSHVPFGANGALYGMHVPSQVVTENSCSSSAICWRIDGGTTRSSVSSQSLSNNIAANNSRSHVPFGANGAVYGMHNPSQVVTENSCSSSAICWRIDGGTTRSSVSSQLLSNNIAANNSRSHVPFGANGALYGMHDPRYGNFR